MRKLLLLATLLSTPTFAADLPRKAFEVPAPAAVAGPFYIGIQAGMGFTPTENLIAMPGLAVGTPKVYPTSPSVGAVVGYLNSASTLAFGAEGYFDYNFSQSGLNCDAFTSLVSSSGCVARMRNSFRAGGDVLVGFNLGQIMTYIPANAQPQNWKVPVVVPTSVVNNIQLLASIGAVGRQAGLCVTDLGTGQDLCGSEWMGGLSAGGQVRFKPATNWDVAVKYHHDFFNHTFTPQQSILLLSNSVTVKGEDRVTVGMNYYF